MATRKRVVTRRSQIDLAPAVKDYLLNRSMRERSAYYEDKLKKELMAVLDEAGLLEGGSKTLLLEESMVFVEYKGGNPKEKTIIGIERRERKSTVMNHDKAMALLERKGLMDECTSQILVINEDAVLAANYSKKITDKELAAIYEDSSSFAFYLTEGG